MENIELSRERSSALPGILISTAGVLVDELARCLFSKSGIHEGSLE